MLCEVDSLLHRGVSLVLRCTLKLYLVIVQCKMGDALKRKRTAARGWATRATASLDTLIRGKDISKIMLQDGIDEVDKRLHALDFVQAEYELSLDEKDIDAEVGDAADFRDGVRKVRIKASERLQELLDMAAGPVADTDSVASEGEAKVQAKLPKLTLPTFSGKILEWTSFWDQYVAIIDQSEMAVINKFAYLKSLLVDEAADAISGLTLSEDNYTTACDILRTRLVEMNWLSSRTYRNFSV